MSGEIRKVWLSELRPFPTVYSIWAMTRLVLKDCHPFLAIISYL